MKKRTAELILQDPEKFAHHDRVFLNNPVVMQGMGLAPLVVLATSGQNAVMLAAAVALLLVPSRVLACLLSRLVPLRDEEPSPAQLQKKLLPRAILYAASAAVVYLAAYPILNLVFGTGLLNLGIYLPMLVVEPLLTYRFGRVQETVHKAVSKGVRITVGYALLLLVIGMVREWLSLGTVFGAPVGRWALLPLAKMPAGGFIVLGILCAIWRAAAAKRREFLKKEAQDTLTVHYQKEGIAVRHLCDWACFLERHGHEIDRQLFHKALADYRLDRFEALMTTAAVRYLGAEVPEPACDAGMLERFMREIYAVHPMPTRTLAKLRFKLFGPIHNRWRLRRVLRSSPWRYYYDTIRAQWNERFTLFR